MISVYAYHMRLVLPVQSLLMCFRSFVTRVVDFVPNNLTLPQTLRLFYVSLRSQAPQQQYIVHYGITLWAHLSQLLVKDSHKRLSSTEKPQYHLLKSLDHTLPLSTSYGEIYGNITVLEKTAFYISCTVAADTSHWMPKSARRQNRENRHKDTQTHRQNNYRQNNYCNPRCACAPRVNYTPSGNVESNKS